MKAEHRKELGTNVLADYLGNVLQHAKEAPSRKVLIVVGVVVAVVLVGVSFWWFSSRSKANDARRWGEWNQLTQESNFSVDQADLDKLDKEYPGTDTETRKRMFEWNKFEAGNQHTSQARLARFQQARLLLHSTPEKLGNPDTVGDAKATIAKARDIYVKLIDESSDVPALAQEALFNAAKASEDIGEFDRARQLYEKLKKDHGKSMYIPAAEKALARLNNPDEMKAIEKLSPYK
jgi:hypothetical protein